MKRQQLRLQKYDYSPPNGYFVTICTHNRENLFGEIENEEMHLNEWGKIVREEWLKTESIRSNVTLDYFVVMPNHFHAILILSAVGATRRVAPTYEPVRGLKSDSLGAIIGQFKSITTKRIHFSSNAFKRSIWQRNYYERIIRNEKELHELREYIVNNPKKWALDSENLNAYENV